MGPVEMTAAAMEMAKGIPVPVKNEGWSVSSYLLAAIGAGMVPFLIALLRFWPAMRKLKDAADGSLRGDLMKRLTEVETELRDTRKAFDHAIAEERRECERRLDAYQRKMDAVTRQFFQFQLSLVRYLPAEASTSAQTGVNGVLAIISRPVEDFLEASHDGLPGFDMTRFDKEQNDGN